MCYLLHLHILLKIHKKENPDYSDDTAFETDENSPYENLDTISASKIKNTFTEWKVRMTQLIGFDNNELYKSIFDYVKDYEDNPFKLNLEKGEIAEKVMEFWMTPILHTSKEKYTEFEINMESQDLRPPKLTYQHSVDIQITKRLRENLDLKRQTSIAKGLDFSDEYSLISPGPQYAPTAAHVEEGYNDNDRKVDDTTDQAIKKQTLDKETFIDKGADTSVKEMVDEAVQVEVEQASSPAFAPFSADPYYTPTKLERTQTEANYDDYSYRSEIKYNQYRTVDDFKRKAVITISNSSPSKIVSMALANSKYVRGRVDPARVDDRIKFVQSALRVKNKFIKSKKAAPLPPSRSGHGSNENRNGEHHTISILEAAKLKLNSRRARLRSGSSIKSETLRT